MKLLQVIASADPAGGGPIEAARQLAICAERFGHSIEFATLDRHSPSGPGLDPGSGEEHLAFPVHRLGARSGGYNRSPEFSSWLATNLSRFDATIVHGIWQYHAIATRNAATRLKHPYFVFPHGMLDPWFKTEFPLKHLKKSLYWWAFEHRVFRDAAAVLFTAEEERKLAATSFWPYVCNEQVVHFGIAPPTIDPAEASRSFLSSVPELVDKRIVLFLGRIHPKKGCDLLLKAFASIAKSDPNLRLVFAGPDQVGLAETLRRLAAELGVSEQVVWTGMLRGANKWGALHACEVFALTSHQENFGISIAEALACGRPVLISNKINIWQEVAADRAGLVEPDTVAGAQALLQRWVALPAEERAAYGRRALACFSARFTAQAMTESVLAVIAAERDRSPRK